jgi:hypothetical protein
VATNASKQAAKRAATATLKNLEESVICFAPLEENEEGSWPRSRRKAGSGSALSRDVRYARNECILLLSDEHVCTSGHKVAKELRRTPLLGTWVKKGQKKGRGVEAPALPLVLIHSSA